MLFRMTLITLFFLFFSLLGNVEAANRYVKADGSCSGLTPCYKTIQSAVNASSTGDTVYVMAGTYAETVTVSGNYTGGGLTITRYGSDSVTISGSGSRAYVINGSRYVTLSYITISGARQYLIRGAGGQNNTIDHCTITGVSGVDKWIYYDGSFSTFTVTNRSFSGYSTYDGPIFVSSGQGFIFRNNTVDASGLASGTAALFFTEWLSEQPAGGLSNYVEGNYFYNLGSQLSGAAAFMFRETDNFYFRNNVINVLSTYDGAYDGIMQIGGMTDGGDGCDNFYVTNNTIITAKNHSTFLLFSDTPNNVKITNNLIIGNVNNFGENLAPLTVGTSNLIQNNRITDSSVTWSHNLGSDWTVNTNYTSQSQVWTGSGNIPNPYYALISPLNGGAYPWNPYTDYNGDTRASIPSVGAFEYSSTGRPMPPILTVQ